MKIELSERELRVLRGVLMTVDQNVNSSLIHNLFTGKLYPNENEIISLRVKIEQAHMREQVGEDTIAEIREQLTPVAASKVARGETICTLTMAKLYEIIRKHLDYYHPDRCDPDAFTQNVVWVEVEKAMGIHPNIGEARNSPIVPDQTPVDKFD